MLRIVSIIYIGHQKLKVFVHCELSKWYRYLDVRYRGIETPVYFLYDLSSNIQIILGPLCLHNEPKVYGTDNKLFA